MCVCVFAQSVRAAKCTWAYNSVCVRTNTIYQTADTDDDDDVVIPGDDGISKIFISMCTGAQVLHSSAGDAGDAECVRLCLAAVGVVCVRSHTNEPGGVLTGLARLARYPRWRASRRALLTQNVVI